MNVVLSCNSWELNWDKSHIQEKDKHTVIHGYYWRDGVSPSGPTLIITNKTGSGSIYDQT